MISFVVPNPQDPRRVSGSGRALAGNLENVPREVGPTSGRHATVVLRAELGVSDVTAANAAYADARNRRPSRATVLAHTPR